MILVSSFSLTWRCTREGHLETFLSTAPQGARFSFLQLEGWDFSSQTWTPIFHVRDKNTNRCVTHAVSGVLYAVKETRASLFPVIDVYIFWLWRTVFDGIYVSFFKNDLWSMILLKIFCRECSSQKFILDFAFSRMLASKGPVYLISHL